MGIQLDSIDDLTDPNCVKVSCKDGKMFQGDLLIAADGVNSQVRKLLGLSPKHFTGNTVWRGSAIADDDSPSLHVLLQEELRPSPFGTFNNGETFVFIFNHHPKLPNRLNWVVNTKRTDIEPGATTPWDIIGPVSHKHELRDVFQRLFQKSAPHDLTKSMKLCTIPMPPDNHHGWGGRGRVTLIGDAAHAMRPSAGLGSSMAFEDVVVLYRTLLEQETITQPLRTRDDWERLIQTFENERLPRVRRIVEEQQHLFEQLTRGEAPRSSDDYDAWVARGV